MPMVLGIFCTRLFYFAATNAVIDGAELYINKPKIHLLGFNIDRRVKCKHLFTVGKKKEVMRKRR